MFPHNTTHILGPSKLSLHDQNHMIGDLLIEDENNNLFEIKPRSRVFELHDALDERSLVQPNKSPFKKGTKRSFANISNTCGFAKGVEAEILFGAEKKIGGATFLQGKKRIKVGQK